MSETEKIERLQYKKNRKKRILVQAVALLLVLLIAIGSFHIYNRLNQTYYIHYTEKGNIDYQVQLLENSFYDEQWQDSGRAYIADLISQIQANFVYALDMDAQNVEFDYQYGIDAQVTILDKQSGQVLYDPTEVLLPIQQATAERGKNLTVSQRVQIDFGKFNTLAEEFIEVYGLKNVVSTLAVTLRVDVVSRCQAFEASNENSYSVALVMPLAQDTLHIETSSRIPPEESKVLACSGGISQNIFKAIGVVAGVLAVILAGILVAYIYLTRNDDINYTIKVKRIVSAYSSYIQRIENEFDTAGYQLVQVKTFVEMLGIRDTLQSPILMNENTDQTCTQFLIPTNTKLLYLFEVKVDNFEELYGREVTVQLV